MQLFTLAMAKTRFWIVSKVQNMNTKAYCYVEKLCALSDMLRYCQGPSSKA